MKKNCENCGKEFDCQHNANCWCKNYTIPNKLSIYLKINYKDCLCEACLKHHINNEKKILLDK